MVLRDVAIGGCKIPLGKVCGSGSDELCVPVVTKKGKHRGDAYISLTFKAGTTKVGAHRLGPELGCSDMASTSLGWR